MGLKHLLGAIWNGRPVNENGEHLTASEMTPMAKTKFSVIQLKNGFLVVPIGNYGGFEDSGATYCATLEELNAQMATLLTMERMK